VTRFSFPPHVRVAAWVVTGPVGHLCAGVVDWAALLARHWWARARRREPPWLRQR
jgi:hypothetical protein